MPDQRKIFISYSTEDRSTAETLYNDLSEAGADVFQFDKRATPGEPAWDEILGWIEESDIFILLASKSALKSRAVKEEIKFAHYQYVNEDRPSTLLPLVMEADLRLPRQLRTVNRISFRAYQAGLDDLLTYLGLAPPAAEPPPRRVEAPPVEAEPEPEREPALPDRAAWVRLLQPGAGRQLGPVASTMGWEVSEPTSTVLAKYGGVILGIALAAALAGSFLAPRISTWLFDLGLMGLTERVGILAESWTWLPWVSRVVVLVILAGAAWSITDSVFPVDTWDYAVASFWSQLVSLLLALLWTFLFFQIVEGQASFVYLSVAVAAGSIFIYALLDEL